MKLVSLLAVAAVALSACSYVPSARYDFAPQYVVTNLDPARLAGTWYEIASFPAPFQKGCFAATATYTAQPDGSLSVLNRCRELSDPSVYREIAGSARQVRGGQLKINLDGVPFGADYWVLDISPDGKTLIVGTPSRLAGWMLSRENSFNPVQMDRARAVFERSGYDINSLQKSKRAP